MISRAKIAFLICTFSVSGLLYAKESLTYNLQQCIERSLQLNADLQAAQASADEYRARVSEVQSGYYPKLSVIAYAAPMFTVHGDALHENVERKYDAESWGPSTHLEMLLAMPVYTFGRLEAGVDAAQSRYNVETARLREAENRIKLEVKKLYYTNLFSREIKNEIEQMKTRLSDIQLKAQELYDAATGTVTKADLMRLRYNEIELNKYLLMAEDGIIISMAGLKHIIGLESEVELNLADDSLKVPEIVEPGTLEQLLEAARRNRPEWAQVNSGLQAAAALRKAEAASKLPVLFVAGNIESNWTPTRDNASNPYHYDPYNNLNGGVAFGAKLDLDWELTKAKVDRANAELAKVKALQQKAITGIPVQVQKARADILRLSEQLELNKDSVKATRKWVVFSTASYMGGVGDVKDVLEGLSAMLKSQHDNLETVLQLYVAQAELNYALGL